MHGAMLAAAILLASVSARAAVEPGRSLPKGEDNPLVVQRIFEAEEGEVQFLRGARDGASTAFLRIASGALIPMREINGSNECVNWVGADNKGLPGPGACELIFVDGDL